MRTERHFHPPEPAPRPEGLPPESARLLEQAIREAVAAAVRLATLGEGDARGSAAPPREPYAPDRAVPDGYPVPSFDAEGRPVVLPVRGTASDARPGGATQRPAGGLGPGSRSGAGALNLGGLAGRQRPVASSVLSASSMAALEAARNRMGPAYRAAPLGRISADTLYFGETSARLVPATSSGAPPGSATVSTRLGSGTFYLNPVPRERLGILAAAAPGAAYAVQRIAADGGQQDTGFLVLTRDMDPVRAGIVAYTTGSDAAPPPTAPAPAGGKGGDPKKAVALIVAALPHLGPTSPAGVATGLLTSYLRDLDQDGLMAALEELRRLGHLGTVLAWARVREFRRFLNERGVPRTYVLTHSELDAADIAAVVGGVVWGAGESYYQIVEIIGILAGSAASERLAQQRHELWQGIVLLVENPLVTGMTGIGLLISTVLEKFEQREFFDLGRIVGQVIVFVWTTWTALKSLPAAARKVAQVSITVTRIGVAALKEFGLGLMDVLRFVLSEKYVFTTSEGVMLMSVGEDVAISGPKFKGTSSLARGGIADALGTAKAPLTDAEFEELFQLLTDAEKKTATAPEPAGGAPAAAGAAMITPQNLEPLVVQALTDVEAMPGSTGFLPTVRGSHMHKAFSDLVKKHFPSAVFDAFSEQPLRTFAKLSQALLDTPVETFVAGTPEVADYTAELKSLFRSKESGAVRLVGDLRPDLVTRLPNGLVVWDLVPVQRSNHVAKTFLYRAILRRGGESVQAAEVYYQHFGRTADEILQLRAYERAARNAAKQRAIAKAVRGRHGPGGKP